MKYQKNSRILLFSILLSALALILSFAGGVFSAFAAWTPSESDWTEDRISDPDEGYAYSFAVVGDTQKLLWYDLLNGTDNLGKMYDWIVDNAHDRKIACVMGLGDVTDANTGKNPSDPDHIFNGNTARTNEYLYAKENINKLADAGIPYTLVRGNHDKPSDASSTEYTFDAYFPYAEYASLYPDGTVGRYDGKYEDGTTYNVYIKFEVAGEKYLILTLDCGVASHTEKADDILEWANKVVSSNPEYKVVLTTHIYLQSDGSRSADATKQYEYYGVYGGSTVWERLVRRHRNIVLVLSGHVSYQDIVWSREKGDCGNTVTQFMINPQVVDLPEKHGGTGLVALFGFRRDGRTVDVEYYSTVRDAYFRKVNQFTFELDKLGSAPDFSGINHTHVYSGGCDCICDLCLKTTRAPKTEHTYSNVCDPLCDVCGERREASHSYTDDCDAVCDNGCGETRIPPHFFKDPTCEKCERPVVRDFYYTVTGGEACVIKYVGADTKVAVPDMINGFPVTSVGQRAFINNAEVTSVFLPDSVEEIGVYAFSGCSALTEVTGTPALRSIGAFAFEECKSLAGFVFPDTLYYIGDSAFMNCSALKEAIIPANLNAVERFAFRGCTSLEKVSLPETLNAIRPYAFYTCNKLSDITPFTNVKNIGKLAFYRCYKLTELSFSKELNTVSNAAFGECRGITDVWYSGSDKPGSDVISTAPSSGYDNKYLTRDEVTWHFGSCPANVSDRTHVFTSDCDAECDLCRKTVREPLALHEYEFVCSEKCSICGSERETEHTYDGDFDRECNICHAVRSTIPPLGVLYGDANGDGDVSAFDVVKLKKFFAEFDIRTSRSEIKLSFGADINGDGKASALDVIRLKKYLSEGDLVT